MRLLHDAGGAQGKRRVPKLCCLFISNGSKYLLNGVLLEFGRVWVIHDIIDSAL